MQSTNEHDQTPRQSGVRIAILHSLLVILAFSLLFTIFFSPSLFSGKLLAPGDGIGYYLPAFYTPLSFWTNQVFAGYPLVGDPQNMTWYPPAMLMRLIPNSWNAYVVLAYVLAGSFAYCYTYTLTRLKLAAAVTGLVYSLCGFMMAHLPHTTIIHAAAWMPLLLCAVEKLRHRFDRLWFVIGIASVACCFLAGHPQIAVYSLGLVFFYTLFLGGTSPDGRWKYYRRASLMIVLGLSLCAIQILPTIEFSRLSLRSAMTFEEFSSFSLPLWQTLKLLFPYFFGRSFMPSDALFNTYWGKYNQAEVTGYVGLMPIMLAVVGTIVYRNRPVVRFWFLTGLITLLLAFGPDLGLGGLLYYVPIYNKFRAQGRHFIEFALAISILAGIGVAAVQRQKVDSRLIGKTLSTSLLVILICLISMVVLRPSFQEKARPFGIETIHLLPWKNLAIGIPLVVFALGCFVLLLWSKFGHRRWSTGILLVMLIVDLSSFGWFLGWESLSPVAKQLEPSPLVQQYRSLLASNYQRLFSPLGTPIFPNLTRLWDLPNASGYSPLMLSRYSEMMGMASTGILISLPVKIEERQLDLMAVRYLLDLQSEMTEVPGVAWGSQELGLTLGENRCGPASLQPSIDLSLPELARSVSEIGFVTTLGCAVTIPEGKSVLQVKVTDVDGNVESHSLLAGRDTSENVYDCPQVKPEVKHGRAPLFKSIAVTGCDVHDYVSTVALTRSQRVKKLELAWSDRGLGGVIAIKHISLRNRAQSISMPVTAMSISPKWKKVEQTEVGTIYENQDVMPRTWLVSQTLQLSPPEILAAIQTSNLPDGRKYDPKEIALVENKRARFQSSALQPRDRATVLKMADTQMEVQTQTAAPAFLVLSDVYYPGWQATIDGKPTRIFQTNYIQRGVKVPAGEHVVRFEFHPLSFKIGVGITTATLVVGGYGLWRLGRKPSSLKEMDSGMPL
ncbi:YfhO family protein [Alkalinema pantanalense CENA528]|uniref:YfhO family protein n=1 Tax=Alkalinema pantanalense TaxID=1620705 RepID=UPI003D6DF1E5